ncbi:MAG: 8-oxo-dGTP diphosphatase [Patescibacteria group bacterium]|nr:8-oxo-dGTP diphosphatase [Patescibacteria group bacterium]
MKNIFIEVAVKAIIVNSKNQVLVLREAPRADGSQAGKYGLPGGRVNSGEYYLDALQREVLEETNLKITVGDIVFSGEWRPVIHGITHQIIGMFFICKLKSDDIKLSSEHDDYKWIKQYQIIKYKFMQPDDKAVIAALKYLKSAI